MELPELLSIELLRIEESFRYTGDHGEGHDIVFAGAIETLGLIALF